MRHDSDTWILLLCGVVIAIAMIAHFERMEKIAFINADDMWMDLVATATQAHGISSYFEGASILARSQGRGYFYFSLALFILPFLIKSIFLRTLTIVAIHFLSLATLCAFLSWYLDRVTSFLVLTLLYCFLPLWWQCYPVNGYPIVYHVPVLLFFTALWIYVALARQRVPVAWRRVLAVAYPILLFFSTFIYEALIPPFLVLWVVVACYETDAPAAIGLRGRVATVVRNNVTGLLAFAACALLYGGYRVTHNVGYEGSSLAPLGLDTLRAIGENIWYFGVAGLPAYNWVGLKHRFLEYSVGSIADGGLIRFLWANLSSSELIQIVGVSAAVVMAGTIAFAPDRTQTNRRRAAIAVLALACVLLLPIPLALTYKYRHSASIWAPYAPGYYSFLCFTVIIAVGVESLRASKSRPFLAVPLLAILGCTTGALTAFNAVANDSTARAQSRMANKWRLLDALLASPAFAEAPPNAVLFAPSLWTDIAADWPGWQPFRDYWTAYVRLHGHHDGVLVTADRTIAAKSFQENRPVYSAEVQNLPDVASGGVLVFGRISKQSLDTGLMEMTAASVFASRDLKSAELVYYSNGKSASAELPPFRRVGAAFGGSAETPGMIPGSAFVVARPINPGAGSSIELSFVRGFFGIERNGPNYWNWNDGSAPEGVLSLLNYRSLPTRVRFHATVIGPGEKSKFDLTVGSATDVVMLKGNEVLDRVITLQPGRNELRIKSYGPRIETPGDPRYLVFGLLNWELTELNASRSAPN